MEKELKPWPALWALVIGFFMILIDTTIVSVANPAIMKGLDLDIHRGEVGVAIGIEAGDALAKDVTSVKTGRTLDEIAAKSTKVWNSNQSVDANVKALKKTAKKKTPATRKAKKKTTGKARRA